MAVIEEDVADTYCFLKRGGYGNATNNKGLFHIGGGSNLITYYNYSAGASTVWCNKTTCKHNDYACTAYVGEDFDLRYVEYNNGHVYKLISDDNGLFLTRFKEDGSEETRIANLLEGYDTAASVEFGRVYNDYMYYIVKKDSQHLDVKCVDMNNKNNVSYLFSLDSSVVTTGASNIFINESGIYLSVRKFIDNGSGSSRRIWFFDKTSRILSELDTSEEVSSCCVNDNVFYLSKDKSLYCISADGEREIHPGLFNELPYDDYFINCNERYIVFMRPESAAFSDDSTDVYIYDIGKDKLDCIKASRTDSASEKNEGQVASDGNLTNTKSGYKFYHLDGLSGRYAFVLGAGNTYYLLNLEKCEVIETGIQVYKSIVKQ